MSEPTNLALAVGMCEEALASAKAAEASYYADLRLDHLVRAAESLSDALKWVDVEIQMTRGRADSSQERMPF